VSIGYTLRYDASVPVVTLTSDFGTVDGYPGAMKGVILSRAPDATVVDITHGIPRHDIAAGAFALANAAPHFPAGTIHVAVVDPGVGGARAAVVVVCDQQIFVGPDNGLLSLVAQAPSRVFTIESPEFCLPDPSTTFHGRDVFAAAAGHLAAGANPADAGPQVSLVGRLAEQAIESPTGQGKAGRVVHVDGFGNLITDLPAQALPDPLYVTIDGHSIDNLSSTYESVDIGELLAYIGSGNTLEIAVREGSAAQRLDVGRGAIVYASENST